MSEAQYARGLSAQVVATAAMFAVNGLTLGSWVSRVPAARDTLGLSAEQMGILLLAPGIGTLLGMPVAGSIVKRLGPRKSLLVGALGTTIALTAMIVGLLTPNAVTVGVGLGLYGLGIALWDVAMNVAGGHLENATNRSLLPLLHASLSFGTILGSLAGVAATATATSVASQLALTTTVAIVAAAFAVRHLPNDSDSEFDRGQDERGQDERGQDERDGGGPSLTMAQAWKEPRTVLIGVTVLAFALCEGIANNWLAIALVDGHHQSESMGALAYAIFISSLTAGRAFGAVLIRSFGRPVSLRLSALLVILGTLLVIFTSVVPLILLGCALWGLGSALGFPVGMSAASDDPRNAAIRVSVVSWIGYGAFFSAPPLVAYLIDHIGMLPALGSVIAAAALAIVTASSTRPWASASVRSPD